MRTLGDLPLADMVDPGFLVGWIAVSGALFAGTTGLSLVLGSSARNAVIRAATAAHGNVGYLGLTLVIGVLGAQASAAVVMAIIVDFLLVVPAVIAAIEFTARPGASVLGAFLRAVRAAIANPFVLAILAGLALSASGLSLPEPVDDFLAVLGGAAVPTALFAIGVTLYGQPLTGPAIELAALSLLKLLIHPLLVLWVMGSLLGLPEEMVAAGVLLAALPVANNVFLLATRYDVQPGIVSGAILVSTGAALLTFNAWAGFLLE